ncbi:diphthine synthase [Rhizoctonia solani]|uniref:diphthine methyl ester synthase n=1 Tax=Rhizoctonia solani TaxID=456999 RepID=A0A8H7LMM5_9AGAM|nr:diphthine synthase [Rhizoctonia solani]
MFYVIGLGLCDEKDITVRGLEAVRKCSRIYLEAYTSILLVDKEKLESFYGKPIITAYRETVETESDEILHNAKEEDVALLVVGDPFGATTHTDMLLRARELGIPTTVIHNASIMNAVGACGLQLYNFGQTVSLPFYTDSWKPDSWYDRVVENVEKGMHTLVLLDIKVREQSEENMARGRKIYEPPRYMNPVTAVSQILESEAIRAASASSEETKAHGYLKPESTLAIALSRVGSPDKQRIVCGTLQQLSELTEEDFGEPLFSVVIVGRRLHELEVQYSAAWAVDKAEWIRVAKEPNSPTKSQSTWSPRPGPSRASSQDPAPGSSYGAVPQSPEVAYTAPPPAYSQAANAPLLPGPHQKPTRRTAATRRFCSAFSVALLIVLIFSTSWKIINRGFVVAWDNDPRPQDGHVVSCSQKWFDLGGSGDENIYTNRDGIFNQTMIPGYPVFPAYKTYTLPISKSLHYIVARGSLSAGVLNIRGSDTIDPGFVDVKVVARYWNQDALSYTKVCELTKPEGGVGIGIYTPSRIGVGVGQQIQWTVTVTFPTASQSPLDLNAFATDIGNFRHSIEGLGDRVRFEHLSLKGSNGAVESNGLSVSQATITTSNSKISGKFSATDSLVLKTTNGAIDTDIDITNDDTHKASSLTLESSNARITSRISLLTTHDQRPQPKGGHFIVRATTSNGRLNISYPTTPVNSLLDFTGETSNSSADVALDAAFEGTFAISTSNSHVDLDDGTPSDPSGKGRKRIVHQTQGSSKAVSGYAFWGNEKDHDRNAETGHVVVSTSNGWARLRL